MRLRTESKKKKNPSIAERVYLLNLVTCQTEALLPVESLVIVKPSESSLYNPFLAIGLKPFDLSPLTIVFRTYPKVFLILSVTLSLYPASVRITLALHIVAKFFQASSQKLSGFTIICASYGHHDREEKAVLANNHMAFAPFYFFVTINAVKGTVISPIDALTVYYIHTYLGRLSHFYSCLIS
jgi:hypothetical protein